ncbi:MAG: glycoside hydrolase domain-containing protein [Gemmatimonadaceae bacterium]
MSRRTLRHPLARWATLVLATAGLAIACGRSTTEPDAESPIARAAAAVAQIAAAVTGQEAPLAAQQQEGRNLGFDTHTYPGDQTMAAWKKAPGAPYRWVGFYLPSPCHKDRSWSGQRQTLVDMGWGLAVVYVGQQTWGRTPRKLTPARVAALVKSKASCNADFVAAERGIADGIDAVAVAESEGFPQRSIVFLDIERMEKMPEAMRAYYRAWSKQLLVDGRYRPGVYVHAHNAQVVYDDVKAEFAGAGIDEEPRMWIASGRGYEDGKAPQDVGFAFAGVWQGMIDVARTVADIKLPLDVNVSEWISPSEPGALGE